MELTILNRIILTRLLPNEGDIFTVRLIKKLREKLSFTDEELKEFKIQKVPSSKGSKIVWDPKVNIKTVDIKLIGEERQLLLEQFNKLDKEKKVTETHLDIYDKLKKFHEEVDKEKAQKKVKELEHKKN